MRKAPAIAAKSLTLTRKQGVRLRDVVAYVPNAPQGQAEVTP